MEAVKIAITCVSTALPYGIVHEQIHGTTLHRIPHRFSPVWHARWQDRINRSHIREVSQQHPRLAAGVESFVEPILAQSTPVGWDQAIDLLFVDGFHSYDHVLADFRQFAPWIRPAARVAVHDCAPHFPAVQRAVSEMLRQAEYKLVAGANSLAVLEKVAA